jgi:uncharacterized RDD family membrane protein YckC
MADVPQRRPSLATRLLGGGARGAKAVAEVTGIDNAVEYATEESIVRALESPAVERALVRVLEGPAATQAIERLMASPAVERAVLDAIDSELLDKAWERLLESDEVQKLIERIAEAPEVRAAITSQGVGLLEDVGRQVRRISNRLDGVVESFARRLMRRPKRTEPSDNAGLITRVLALVIDGGIVNGAFLAVAALFTFVMSAVFDFDASTAGALTLSAFAFVAITSGYLLFFWTLAGRTPGMRLLGIRLDDFDGTHSLSPRTAIRRLWGTVVAAVPLGLGFLAILVSDRRQGWQDRIANTEVVLVDRKGEPESATRRATEPVEAPAA